MFTNYVHCYLQVWYPCDFHPVQFDVKTKVEGSDLNLSVHAAEMLIITITLST